MIPSDSTDFAGPQASTAFLVRRREPWITRAPEAATTAFNAFYQQETVKDADLANLDGFTKLGGSALIAGLGAASAKVHGTLIGEALGMATFFTAMAAIPKALYSWVYASKKVNLDQYYKNNHGVIRPLFEDNQFRLDLLPEEEMELLAHQFGIPDGPAQHRLTLDRMNQMAVQTRTLWMLLAGPATIALGGLTCHLIESKLHTLTSQLSWIYHLNRSSSANTLSSMQQHLEKAMDHLMGKRANSSLAHWWDNFGDRVLRESGMLHMLPDKSILDRDTDLNQKIATRLSAMVDPKEAPKLDHMAAWLVNEKKQLKKQRNQIEEILKSQSARLTQNIENKSPHLSPEVIRKEMVEPYLTSLDEKMRTAFSGAVSTIEHHIKLFKTLQEMSQKNVLPADALPKIIAMIEDATPGAVYEAMEEGRYHNAKTLAGGKFRMDMVSKLKNESLPLKAAQWMGASPAQTLSRALRHSAQGNLYRKFAVGTLLTASGATFLFTRFVLGGSFAQPKPKKPAQNPEKVMITNPTFRRYQINRYQASRDPVTALNQSSGRFSGNIQTAIAPAKVALILSPPVQASPVAFSTTSSSPVLS